MRKKYGVFVTVSGGFGGLESPLVLKRTLNNDEFENIQREIDDDEHIPDNTKYIVLQYWEYFKPRS